MVVIKSPALLPGFGSRGGGLLLDVPVTTFLLIAGEVIKFLHIGGIHAYEVEIMLGLGRIDISHAGDSDAGGDEG